MYSYPFRLDTTGPDCFGHIKVVAVNTVDADVTDEVYDTLVNLVPFRKDAIILFLQEHGWNLIFNSFRIETESRYVDRYGVETIFPVTFHPHTQEDFVDRLTRIHSQVYFNITVGEILWAGHFEREFIPKRLAVKIRKDRSSKDDYSKSLRKIGF